MEDRDEEWQRHRRDGKIKGGKKEKSKMERGCGRMRRRLYIMA